MALAPILFDPAKWYWIVASDTTQVFSSEAGAYVPVGDANYSAWLASGHAPTRIATEQELWDYLAGRVLDAVPVGKASSDTGKDGRIKGQLTEVIYQIAFDQENRIRALEKKTPLVTRQEFYAYVKTLMR